MPPGSSSNEIGVEEIAFYYEEMVRSGLSELEIETPQGKIVLKRRQKEAPLKEVSYFRRKTDSAPKKQEELPSNLKIIASPVTGVFYRSSSPQSPPFIKEGGIAQAGMTLCIVEAMKVMNEIKADCNCKIVRIMAENAKPVSKGQPMFHVEPM